MLSVVAKIQIVLPPPEQLITIIVIGLIIGLFAEIVIGTRMPFGYFGSILLGALGCWFTTRFLDLRLPLAYEQYEINGVPLVRAAIGSLVMAFLWALISRLINARHRHL